jgi:sulfoxide reductase heme-binding subunit YedZ
MSEALWAFGRVSGGMSLLFFTASVVLGIVTRSGRPLPGLPRFSISLIHRNIAILASVFLVLHVGTLILDPFAHLRVIDTVVPFIGSFKPVWQGLGTVAFDLILAIVITSLFRRWLGARLFTAVHWFTYAMWPIAVIHSIGNGTNGTNKWFLLFVVVCAVSVVSASIWRVSGRYLEVAEARAGRVR